MERALTTANQALLADTRLQTELKAVQVARAQHDVDRRHACLLGTCRLQHTQLCQQSHVGGKQGLVGSGQALLLLPTSASRYAVPLHPLIGSKI